MGFKAVLLAYEADEAITNYTVSSGLKTPLDLCRIEGDDRG